MSTINFLFSVLASGCRGIATLATCSLLFANAAYSSQAHAASQTVTFDAQTNESVAFRKGGTFTIHPLATSTSGLPVSYSSGSAGVCSISGTTVTMLSIGTCSLWAGQSGNADYEAAPPVIRYVRIAQGTQALTFGEQSAQTFTPGGTFAINPLATSTSEQAILYSSLTPGVCTAAGNRVTMVSAGICTIAANQYGDANYKAAAQVTTDITIRRGPQLISFTVPGPMFLGVAPLTVRATGGPSGNPVMFTSLTPTVCSASGVNGSLVTMLLAGTCTIRASQAGNASYDAAAPVDRSFAVTSGSSKVTVESSANPSPYRSSVTLTARIAGVIPGGSARFLNGAATLCDAPVVKGLATCTVSNLMEDAHSIRVHYQGDVNNQAAYSNELVQVVSRTGVHQGAWWGGVQENGWGLSIIEQGETLVAGWYFFDTAGKPTWLIVPGCVWNANRTACTGPLQRATSSWFGNYNAADVRLSQVGTATLSFNDPDNGRFDYTVQGTSGSKHISRLALGVNPKAPFDLTNVWGGGLDQIGWALSLFTAGEALAGVWYTYDTEGQPTWMLFNGGGWQNGTRYRSQLIRASGSPMIGVAYDAGRLNAQAVGEMHFEFIDINSGDMAYSVDGIVQAKRISKLRF